MFRFYKIEGTVCCAGERLDLPETGVPQPGTPVVWLTNRSDETGRSAFCATDAGQLYADGLALLNKNELPALPERLPECVRQCFAQDGLRVVNIARPGWQALLHEDTAPGRKRVHILAMGDVGGTLLTGLRLLGGDVVDSIGIFDMNRAAAARWEFEVNQIVYPWQYDLLPPVEIIGADQLFDCDVFVFAASRGVPPVGSEVKDVRMAQLALNRPVVEEYAVRARQTGFKGLFAVVSDPVDQLAAAACLASNRGTDGRFDGQGLRAEQIQGFGLGVMNARAAYYAKKEERFSDFLREGRVYGPHGQDLVVANSLEHYDDEKSRELSARAVQANRELRALGYKPYIAPAFSSGALSLLLTMRGEWHYGSVYLDGIFMGVRNRYTALGQQTELAALPQPLYERILHAADGLKATAHGE